VGSHEGAEAGSGQLTVAVGDGPVDIVDGVARLVAGRCVECAALSFPRRGSCATCGGAVERMLLPGRGTLWTWTTQGFEPKPPYVADGDEEFVPYGVGYVEFAGFLRIEGRLTDADPTRLAIGMPVSVVAVERAGRTSYAFAPVAQ
jgi:uncharacterized OB-fold protein